MPRDANIFHNLVDDEPSTTELFCNLMRIPAVRHLLLGHFLTEACASQIAFEDISTRIRLDDGDCPDVVIENSEIFAFLEIKVDPRCKLTARQLSGSYLKPLEDDRRLERWLIFLVPEDWKYIDELKKSLGGFDGVHPESGVHTRIMVWKKDVLNVIEKSGLKELSPIVIEFIQLLSPWFTPLVFSRDEVHMLESKELGAAMAKLYKLVERIRQESRRDGYKQSKSLTGEIYFRNEGGKDVLWFGVWPDVWKETGHPLCFGVDQNWGAEVLNSFRNACKARIDFKSDKIGVWTLACVSEETLESENAAHSIWEQLRDVLRVMPRE